MIQHKVLDSRSTSVCHGFVDFIKDYVNDTCYYHIHKTYMLSFLFMNITISNIHEMCFSPKK